MKLFYCLLLSLCPYVSKSQRSKITALGIGDKIPGNILMQLLSTQAKTPDLSVAKSKLIILDFWATWCGNCIKKFPMLDSMQQANPSSLQVLLVNTAGSGDNQIKVDRLFARVNAGRSRPIQLPVILSDSILTRYFPHNLLPHYVWLGQDGVILAITDGDAVTRQNILAAISGHLPTLPFKEDLENFNASEPLFINGNGGSGQALKSRSSFAAYIPGLPPSSRVNTISGSGATHLLYTNMPAVQLLSYAYRSSVNKNRIYISTADSTGLYPFDKDESWLQANSFTYELITSAGKDTAFIYMQQDLQRYLGLAARTANLRTACYILSADTALLSRYTAGGNTSAYMLNNNTNRCIQNRQLSALVSHLDAKLPLPVIDETAFLKTVNICLPDGLDVQDIAALQTALQPYGLSLTPAHRMLPNFIIYQKNN